MDAHCRLPLQYPRPRLVVLPFYREKYEEAALRTAGMALDAGEQQSLVLEGRSASGVCLVRCDEFFDGDGYTNAANPTRGQRLAIYHFFARRHWDSRR